MHSDIEVQIQDNAEEIKRLQRCINNLVSVLALPVMWSGHDSSQIAITLLDSLVRMLQLDFAYVRISDSGEDSWKEWARSPGHHPIEAEALGRALGQSLTSDRLTETVVLPNPAGEGVVSVVVFRLGLRGELGRFAAASHLADFPTEIDQLVLQVAANQAAVGLQEARYLRQAQADLARANRVSTMGELSATLAHEVNQPIAATIIDATACLRWLSREQPDLGEARVAASRIVQSGQRAVEIVNRVRQLFKKETLQRELIDLHEIVREMARLLQSEASQYAVLVRTQLAASLPQVMGDRVQLQQVLMNLMMNSIDAMKDVDGARELVIQSQRDEDGQVLISVSDTGVGLPPQQAEKIFDAFFTTKTHGTGMGLRIGRSIVESHGGRLWAVDNSPRGARFCFTLPVR